MTFLFYFVFLEKKTIGCFGFLVFAASFYFYFIIFWELGEGKKIVFLLFGLCKGNCGPRFRGFIMM